jgi:DNA replication protein DnaC
MSDWLDEIVGPMRQRWAEDAAAREAHRATCTADACEVCGRWRCLVCGAAIVDGPERACATCEASTRQARVRDAVRESLPAAHRDATLEVAWLRALVGDDAIARARTATTSAQVLLVGPAGTGKTSLAAAMFQARLEPRACWCSAFELARARASARLGEEAPLVAAALRAPLLVVDELGAEEHRPGSAVVEVIYERHAEQRPTWVTTGMTSASLSARYGGGILRRVTERAEIFQLRRV